MMTCDDVYMERFMA